MSETESPEGELKIGDVVQVKSINTRLSGLVGVIKSRQQTFPFSFEVDIEGERELQSFHPDNLIKCVPLPVGPSVAVERCAVCKHEGPRDPNTGICLWSNPVDEFDGSCGHGCTTFESVNAPANPCPQCQSGMELQLVCEHYGHREPVDSLRTEGPTGCLDDGDELSLALRKITPERLNEILNEELGPQSPGDVPERIWLVPNNADGSVWPKQVWAEPIPAAPVLYIRADIAKDTK